MSNIKQFAVNSLPAQEDREIGSIYFTKDGSQHVVNSDKTTTRITDIVFLEEINEETVGTEGQLYVVNYDLYKFEEGAFVQLTKDSNVNEMYGLDIKGSFKSIQEMADSDKNLVQSDGFYIISGTDEMDNEDDVGKIFKFNSENQEFVYLGNLRGRRGLQGVKGDVGAQGERGETGADGLQGEKGDTGAQGEAGERGEKGDQGEKGDRGITGETGEQGEIGNTGEKGDQGERGEKGDTGEKGEMGDGFYITKSYKTILAMQQDFVNPLIPIGAFVIISSDEPDTDPDNSKIFVKTEDEYKFQSVLRGLKGDTGQRGEQGERGLQGEIGNTGARGIQGIKGDRGLRGKAVTVKGTLSLVSQLPTTNRENGDAYWVTETNALHVFSDNPEDGIPAWVQSPVLKGDKGDTGSRGTQGADGKGIEDLGTATLLTEDKTLKGAINEVFTRGNSVKRNMVDTLLSKDNTLPVDANSTWDDIIQEMENLKLGYKVNGTNDESEFASEDIKEGDFIAYYKASLGTQNTITGSPTIANITRIAHAQISGNRVLVAWGLTDNRLYLSILEKDSSKINLISSLSVTNIAQSGRTPDLIKMKTVGNQHFFVVACSRATDASPNWQLIFNTIVVEGDVITNKAYSFPAAVDWSGDDVSIIRLDNTRFFAATTETATSARLSIFTHNSDITGNNANAFVRGATEIFTAGNRNMKLLRIQGNRLLYVTGLTTSGTEHSTIYREILVDLNNNTFTLQGSTTYVYNAAGHANSMRAIEIPSQTIAGQNDILVFGRDANRDNQITARRIVTYAQGVANTTSIYEFATGKGSGGTGLNSRTSIHSAAHVGNGVVALVYSNPSVNNHPRLAMIDTKKPADQVKLEKDTELTSSVQSSVRLDLIQFEDKSIGLIRPNSQTNATPIWERSLLSLEGYRKYRNTLPVTTAVGIALKDASAFEKVEVRK